MTSGDPVVRIWDSSTGRQIAEHRLAPSALDRGRGRGLLQHRREVPSRRQHDRAIHVLDARTLAPAGEPIQVYAREKGRPAPPDVYDFTPSADLHTVYLNDPSSTTSPAGPDVAGTRCQHHRPLSLP